MPLLAADTLHVGPEGFGLLSASFGLGALIGALATATFREASWRLFAVGTASFGVLVLLLAPVHNAYLAGTLLFGIGIAFTLFTANANALVQLAAPDHLRGRLIGLYLFAFLGLAPSAASSPAGSRRSAGRRSHSPSPVSFLLRRSASRTSAAHAASTLQRLSSSPETQRLQREKAVGPRGLDSVRMAADKSIGIALENVSKRFGQADAVRDVTLAIHEGEFFSLLGPSGCGKTTTLRMIAGFEVPDEGRIILQGRDVTTVFSNRRPVNMVFQQYALFPHMSIYDNVAFGLKVKRIPRQEHRGRVLEILRVVELEGLENRRPRQLSGGQQQRVALARALVNQPAALLLDEPLGALDVKLRKQMQLELKRIQTELGTTFVYVTHDQDEALAMSDRIAVMNRGQVEQIGGPREIYDHPATAFVADFVGSLNTLELTVDEIVGGFAVMRAAEGDRVVLAAPQNARVGTTLRVAVRPERVRIAAIGAHAPDGGSLLEGTIAEVVYLGMYTQFHVTTGAGRVVASRLADELVDAARGRRARSSSAGSRSTRPWSPVPSCSRCPSRARAPRVGAQRRAGRPRRPPPPAARR